MASTPRPTRDDFDFWVADMDDALDRFRELLPEDVSRALDGSEASLDALEAWLLERYPDTQSMLAAEEAAIVDGAARYIGEILRRAVGGYWDIQLDDERDVYYGLPVITTGEKATPVAPATLATAAADRRTGSFIRQVVAAHRA